LPINLYVDLLKRRRRRRFSTITTKKAVFGLAKKNKDTIDSKYLLYLEST
jgi:hypothetical protein